MVVAKHFGECPKKNYFGPKNSTLGLKKGHFGQSGPWNSPPSNQTATYRKTNGIQSYLWIWGTYDPIESSPSEPRKGRLCGCSVKKSDFEANFGPKTCPCTPQELARHYDKHENIVFLVPSHHRSKKFGGCPQKNGFWAQKQHFWAQKGPFWAIGPKKRPAERPNGHLPENQRYPELPHDMGDLWSHWVGSVWPQKMGVIWV